MQIGMQIKAMFFDQKAVRSWRLAGGRSAAASQVFVALRTCSTVKARSIRPRAICGFVWNSTSSGT